jgi:hypothetical protein
MAPLFGSDQPLLRQESKEDFQEDSQTRTRSNNPSRDFQHSIINFLTPWLTEDMNTIEAREFLRGFLRCMKFFKIPYNGEGFVFDLLYKLEARQRQIEEMERFIAPSAVAAIQDKIANLEQSNAMYRNYIDALSRCLSREQGRQDDAPQIAVERENIDSLHSKIDALALDQQNLLRKAEQQERRIEHNARTAQNQASMNRNTLQALIEETNSLLLTTNSKSIDALAKIQHNTDTQSDEIHKAHVASLKGFDHVEKLQSIAVDTIVSFVADTLEKVESCDGSMDRLLATVHGFAEGLANFESTQNGMNKGMSMVLQDIAAELWGMKKMIDHCETLPSLNSRPVAPSVSIGMTSGYGRTGPNELPDSRSLAQELFDAESLPTPDNTHGEPGSSPLSAANEELTETLNAQEPHTKELPVQTSELALPAASSRLSVWGSIPWINVLLVLGAGGTIIYSNLS